MNNTSIGYTFKMNTSQQLQHRNNTAGGRIAAGVVTVDEFCE